ncbi:hypothetical protein ATCC90586_000979 [Pythium insidiosum]|nr:hypothetical protein ATCC90586_000979 [Pythium insidiosum]
MPFFACYLLTPVNAPQRLRCTYVGFTVAPTRRIRQHNGELVSGAKRTTRHRPWEMIAVVHGFPTKFHALQFEYAWQHPYVCRFTRERLATLKGARGLGQPRSVKRKLVELHEMLHVLPWSNFPLTVTYTSRAMQDLVRATAFFAWPPHMTIELRPLAELAALERRGKRESDSSPSHPAASGCYVCDEPLSGATRVALRCYHDGCGTLCHSLCLADHFLLEQAMAAESLPAPCGDEPSLRPERGTCPACGGALLWPLVVANPVSLVHAANADADEMAAAPASTEERSSSSDREHESYSDSGWFEDDEIPRHDELDASQVPDVIDLTMDDD